MEELYRYDDERRSQTQEYIKFKSIYVGFRK